VEDEDYQLRYKRVAGIDVAKAKADVCTRLPAAREGGRRTSRVETVGATAREVLAAYSDESDRSVRGFRTPRVGGRVAADAGRLSPLGHLLVGIWL
jgi:hypothetical protein